MKTAEAQSFAMTPAQQQTESMRAEMEANHETASKMYEQIRYWLGVGADPDRLKKAVTDMLACQLKLERQAAYAQGQRAERERAASIADGFAATEPKGIFWGEKATLEGAAREFWKVSARLIASIIRGEKLDKPPITGLPQRSVKELLSDG